MFSWLPMASEKTMLLEQIQVLENLIPQLDNIYAHLTQILRTLSPILQKKLFNQDDQSLLKDSLHNFHLELDEFGQCIRRGEGERELLRGEILRLKAAHPKNPEDYALVEAELWATEQSLLIREKGLNHLNELFQLLDSIMRTGEMTEFDERLLTDILTDLKNLAD